jgi:hypothetical protein
MVFFEFENLHTVKIDKYEIQIKQFNRGCQAPRNYIRQLQRDEKTQAMEVSRGLCEKNSKNRTLKMSTL